MVIGIDTASVAGNKIVDWTKAKSSGIAFAIIRAAYGTGKDTKFDQEWPRIKAAGIVRGAYLFLRFPCHSKNIYEVPTPIAQAEAVCKFVGKLDPNDFPISLDVEFPGKGQPDTGMTSAQLLKGVLEAWNVLKTNYGVAPWVYTSARVFLDDLRNLPAPWIIESPLWLAKYAYAEGPAVMNPGNILNPPVPPPWAGDDPAVITWRGKPYTNSDWCAQQYQGNASGCLGFSGMVDMNRFQIMAKGDSGERIAWVQRRLGFKGTSVDGKFGPVTDTAVRKLQASKPDVVADGIVGPRTYAYLCWQNP